MMTLIMLLLLLLQNMDCPERVSHRCMAKILQQQR
jgi:hypothetical protein